MNIDGKTIDDILAEYASIHPSIVEDHANYTDSITSAINEELEDIIVSHIGDDILDDDDELENVIDELRGLFDERYALRAVRRGYA